MSLVKRSFSRSFHFPKNFKQENVVAQYADRVLKLAIEKIKESTGKPRNTSQSNE